MGTNPYDLTDDVCAALIVALDDNDHEISDRDCEFVESNLGHRHFSDPQKKWCGHLIDRYEHYLENDWRVYYSPKEIRKRQPAKPAEEDDALGYALS